MRTTAIDRGALAGLVGGTGWVLFPWGTPFAEAEEGTPVLGDIASGVYFWLLLVVPAALLLLGLAGLHAMHRERYGRLGGAGSVLTGIGLAGMFVGLGWEATSSLLTGEESAVGHVFWMVGFLLLLPGSILLGIAVRRARVLRRAGLAGVALILVIPIAVAVAIPGGAFLPGNTGFWLGLTMPYGLTWVMLASAMRAAQPEVAGRLVSAVA